MSIRTCPQCGRLSFEEDLQRREWRCTVRTCDYREPTGDPVAQLRAENILLKQQLADVETSDLPIAIQERAELRDQRDALTLRLQASEEQRSEGAEVRSMKEFLSKYLPNYDPPPDDIPEEFWDRES